MQKQELFASVYSSLREKHPEMSITREAVKAVVNESMDVMAAELLGGGKVPLGFAFIQTVMCKARMVNSPLTGGMITIPAQRRLKIRPTKYMKDALQN